MSRHSVGVVSLGAIAGIFLLASEVHGGPLLRALDDGDYDLFKQLVREGADPNEHDEDGNTPLHEAIKKRESITPLLELGANVNAKTKWGKTPLHIAANSVYFSESRIPDLINYGADLNAQDNEGNTPLHIAANSCAIEGVKILLRHNPDLRIMNVYKRSAAAALLHKYESVSRSKYDNCSDVQHISKLIVEHADKALIWHTPLFSAILENDTPRIKQLIDAGHDVQQRYAGDQQSPLHLATTRNNLTVVKWLIEKGAKVDAQNVIQETPLHFAAIKGYSEIATVLLQHGADPNTPARSFGATPLHIAVRYDHIEVARLLLDHGASVNRPVGRTEATWFPPSDMDLEQGNDFIEKTIINMPMDLASSEAMRQLLASHGGKSAKEYFPGTK